MDLSLSHNMVDIIEETFPIMIGADCGIPVFVDWVEHT